MGHSRPASGRRGTIARMAGVGSISNPDGANVWPHEMRTAQALAAAGHDVMFVRKSDAPHERTADLVMDGMPWEMKAPRSSAIRRVQRTLRDALKQSRNVVFDTRRMGNLPDAAIERELRKWARELRSLDRLVMVCRGGIVVEIK